MGLFSRKQVEEPRIASDVRVQKTYVERKCPSCYGSLAQEKMEEVVYDFPSRNKVTLWKAQYGCGPCGFHEDLWLSDGARWVPITPDDFNYLQSDGVRTNETTLRQYLEFLRTGRDYRETVRRNVQRFFGG